MQVCYFTGDMCQVDWQKNSEHRKLSLSLQHRLWTLYQSGGCQGQHGQTGGEEFRERSTPPLAEPLRCRVLNTTEPKWILQIFYASDRYMWQPKVRRRKRDDGENMREREKRRKTGSSIFSEAQHSTLLLKPHRLFRKRIKCLWNTPPFQHRKTWHW